MRWQDFHRYFIDINIPPQRNAYVPCVRRRPRLPDAILRQPRTLFGFDIAVIGTARWYPARPIASPELQTEIAAGGFCWPVPGRAGRFTPIGPPPRILRVAAIRSSPKAPPHRTRPSSSWRAWWRYGHRYRLLRRTAVHRKRAARHPRPPDFHQPDGDHRHPDRLVITGRWRGWARGAGADVVSLRAARLSCSGPGPVRSIGALAGQAGRDFRAPETGPPRATQTGGARTRNSGCRARAESPAQLLERIPRPSSSRFPRRSAADYGRNTVLYLWLPDLPRSWANKAPARRSAERSSAA